MGLKPFFTFYGGKWRAAPLYPSPSFDTVIEPFAGSAGYALRHYDRSIILVERDPVIAGLWRWLIRARPEEIRRLPLISPGQTVAALDVHPAARTLIGFWLNKGCAVPCKQPSAWMRQGLHPKSFWGPEIRERIASQVDAIKHWSLIEGDYSQAPRRKATWFIDPPYMLAGNHYKHGSKDIDFEMLAQWCRRRRGQVLVCENLGATWLPFTFFRNIKASEARTGGKVSREALYSFCAD